MSRCKSCGAPLWWRVNPSGKRQPMNVDLVTGTDTQTPHHATCPSVAQHRTPQPTAAPDAPAEPLPWWYR